VSILTLRASRYDTLRALSGLPVRRAPDVRRSHEIDRPATAGNRHGRGRTLAAAPAAQACIAGRSPPLGGARRVRSEGTYDPRAHRVAGHGRGHPPGVRVPPAFSTPSGLWAMPRPHAPRAPRWRHFAQPLSRPVHVAARCTAQLRYACLFQKDHHRYQQIMSRKILSVLCASLPRISYLCHIIIHGVMVCDR
jgi:hypothetical protein